MAMLLMLFFLGIGEASAGWVNGYFRSDGTYVNGYYRSDPNGLKYENYSWDSNDDWYNPSYYDYDHSSEWRTPAWETQDDYWTGLDSYQENNDYDGWFDDSYDYDYDYDSYDYDYDSYDSYDSWY